MFVKLLLGRVCSEMCTKAPTKKEHIGCKTFIKKSHPSDSVIYLSALGERINEMKGRK